MSLFRRRAREPRTPVVTREDANAAWEAFRGAHPTTRHATIALVLAVAAQVAQVVTHTHILSGPALLVIAFVGVVFLHRKRPESTELITDEELARHDAARDFMEAEEWVDSGAGEEAYERAVEVLLGLVGEEVSVYGGGGVPWKALIILSGVLLDGHPAGDGSLEDELLVFGVGTGGSFMIERAQLEAPGAVVHYDPFRGLTLTNADGSGLRILQESRHHV